MSIVEKFIKSRGITDPVKFCNAPFFEIEPSNTIGNIHKAVETITEHVAQGKKIVIFGDYDVDGVTSTSMLVLNLRRMNANVVSFTPNRITDGYGFTETALKTVYESHRPDLIITVDCGITAVREVEMAKDLGIKVIVTDHHNYGDIIPDCIILHPRIGGTNKFTDICGAGVAYKLSSMLPNFEPNTSIGLAAIGTVADVMPLVGDNRVIVKTGLTMLPVLTNFGIKSILSVCGLDKKEQLEAEDIGFGIAPRINAAGRLKTASMCVRMFTTKVESEALDISNRLELLNQERKQIESSILAEAVKEIENNNLHKENIVIVSGKNWNKGVVGIIASRIVSKYKKPAIVMTELNGNCSGSGRTYGNLNLHSVLSSCSVISQFGGHAAAVGIKELDSTRLDELRSQASKYIETIGIEHVPIKFDGICKIKEFNVPHIHAINAFGPFGNGFPAPCFKIENCRVYGAKKLGDKGDHVSCTISDDTFNLRAVAFGRPGLLESIQGSPPDHVYVRPVISSYSGNPELHLA